MTLTNKNYIEKGIRMINQSFSDKSNSSGIYSFWENFQGEKVSYMGFNFEEDKVSSVKIYFVVYTETIDRNVFPIPELYLLFEEIIKKHHPSVTQKFSCGGGITFSIKAKIGSENLEYGCYLKCTHLSTEESKLIDFSDSQINSSLLSDAFGIYNTIEGSEKKTAIYGYVNPPDLGGYVHLDYMQYENIRGLEIARLNNTDRIKYIYIGGEDVYKNQLLKQIPPEVIKLKNLFKLNLVCPAFNNQHKLCTVYLTDYANDAKLPHINDLAKYQLANE